MTRKPRRRQLPAMVLLCAVLFAGHALGEDKTPTPPAKEPWVQPLSDIGAAQKPADAPQIGAAPARAAAQATGRKEVEEKTATSWQELLRLPFSTSGVTLFLLLTVLLFALLRWFRRLVRLVPMAKTRRSQVGRALLVSETAVVLIFLLSAIPLVFDEHPTYTPIVVGLLILSVVWMSWFVIRDAVAGLFLKAGEVVRLGDTIRVDELEGRITRLGYRVLELETPLGSEVIVPFSRLTRASVARTPAVENVFRHTFEVPRPSEVAVLRTRETIRRTALNHHWSSLAREPQIVLEPTALIVTVYSLDEIHGTEIEATVRHAVAART